MIVNGVIDVASLWTSQAFTTVRIISAGSAKFYKTKMRLACVKILSGFESFTVTSITHKKTAVAENSMPYKKRQYRDFGRRYITQIMVHC